MSVRWATGPSLIIARYETCYGQLCTGSCRIGVVFRYVGTFAKSDSWLRHVCLSARMEQLGSQWTDFHEL
jgi:hypothetical protein